jgi:hypothetical protein
MCAIHYVLAACRERTALQINIQVILKISCKNLCTFKYHLMKYYLVKSPCIILLHHLRCRTALQINIQVILKISCKNLWTFKYHLMKYYLVKSPCIILLHHLRCPPCPILPYAYCVFQTCLCHGQ